MFRSPPPITAIQIKHFIIAVLALCVFGLIAGCKSNQYELKLQPDGPVLKRQLSVWVEGENSDEGGAEFGNFPEARLRHIVTAYGVEMPEILAARHEFQGEFAKQTPDDIGGDGFYQSWPSSLGTAYIYVEQFRGNDALNAGIAQRQLAANRAVDVLVLWLESEFAASDDLQVLLDAVDTKLRGDLLDLGAYSWIDDALPFSAFDEEALIVRLLHYMVRRGYFDAGQVPVFYHAAQAYALQDDISPLADVLVRGFATRFGVPADAPLPTPLSAIRDDLEAYGESFDEFIDNSEALRALEHTWAEADGADNQAKAASAESVFELGFPFAAAAVSLDGGRGSELNLELHTHYEPEITNGEWDGERGVVSWEERLVSDNEHAIALPTSVFAMWVKPGVDFQLQHLGRVAIESELLAEYCIWRNGLPAEHGEEWDRFLASIESDADFMEKIDAFRFSGYAADSESALAASSAIISKLIKALE